MTDLLKEEQYVDMDAEDFLELVYGEREGWIDLPAKVNGYWVPFHTEWPADGTVSRRIDSSLRDGEDLYYSVAQFTQRGRNIEHVLPSHWLWADLDEVHPTEGARHGFLPTVAVESSPGRYQALWRLTRELRPRTLEKLNRGLSYSLDADRGGWDLTQVLRIPGTRNFKYSDQPIVRVLWLHEDLVYDPKYLWTKVKELIPPQELIAATDVAIARKPLTGKIKRLLRVKPEEVVEGERSDRLWELECMLLEAGLTEDETFKLVWPTAWNKWAEVNTGRQRLEREIRKAAQHVRRKLALRRKDDLDPGREGRTLERPLAETGTAEDDGSQQEADDSARDVSQPTDLPFVGYASFMAMAMEEPKWLVRDIWTADSHGIIGGEPKTQKTSIALALALSVASGEPFLGEYPVGVTGPVLIVQEENAPWMMQDRLRKLAQFYGLISKEEVTVSEAGAGALGSTSVELQFPTDLPLKLLNNFGFNLAVEEHRDMLWAEVEATRPKLVILDPMYLVMAGADQNNAGLLTPFLQWILKLRYQFDTAVAVIHHMKKQQASGPVVRAGQRLMGNAILHGWVDSALYTSALEDQREGWTRTMVETEFRSMAPQKPIEMALFMGAPGALNMEVDISRYDFEGLLVSIVRDQPGVTITALAEELGLDKRTALARCRGSERLEVTGGGKGRGKQWKVYLAGKAPKEKAARREGRTPPKGAK